MNNRATIQIREAGREDAALVARLSRETFAETFAAVNEARHFDQFMREQFSPELLEAEVGAAGNTFFLAFEGEVPAGYLKMREDGDKPAFAGKKAIEIARIYVKKSMIGKGIGALLMQKAIDFALLQEKELVWLGVWEKNETAIAFYRKWGFLPFDTHVFMMGNDPQTDWLMMKQL